MLAQWTGEVVGKMHVYSITGQEIADQMGVTKAYISMLLNCRRTPKDAQTRVETALNRLIKEHSTKE